MRLDKRLAHAGYGTRSEVRLLVKSGAVTVDGSVVLDAGFILNDDMEICVYGKPVLSVENRYIMLYKPAGVVSATEDAHDRTVLDLLPPELTHDLFPAGRLDKDTEGLLILTDDGDYSHRLTAPKKYVTKLYHAAVSGTIDQHTVEMFAQGIALSDGAVRPAKLCIIGPWGDTDWTEVTVEITEGKYHQVKRMFHVCNANVEYLRRERIGALELDLTLEVGQWRHMTKAEQEAACETGEKIRSAE